MDKLINAIAEGVTGPLDYWTEGYRTPGGTYIVASAAASNDDNRRHDLVAILPAPIGVTRVVILRPTVNPDLVTALRKRLDGEK